MRVSNDSPSAASMPDGVKRVYDALSQQVASAHATWKLFTQLFCHSEARVALLNRMLPDFSKIVFHALRNSVVMSLCRLTDPPKTRRKKNLCIRRLASCLGETSFKSRIPERIKNAEDSCRAFRSWRNKRLGHTDWEEKAHFVREPLPNITTKQFDDSLSCMAEVLNTVMGHFGGGTTPFDMVMLEGDGDWLAACLEKLEANDEAQRRKELGLSRLESGD